MEIRTGQEFSLLDFSISSKFRPISLFQWLLILSADMSEPVSTQPPTIVRLQSYQPATFEKHNIFVVPTPANFTS